MANRTLHDLGYKLLFGHPEMITDLLRGYVAQPWIEHLDFNSLERVSGHYVTTDLRSREDDMLWRLKWRGQPRWLYIYLLLEFQSTPDSFMALRVMTYLGLLYQDLVKARQLLEPGKLPPVLPLVLYNGKRPWHARTEMAELIDSIPGGLEAFRPSLRYLLLDKHRYANNPLPDTRNLVAGMFSLENDQTPENLHTLLGTLFKWLSTPEQASLRHSFFIWLKQVLPLPMHGIKFDQLQNPKETDDMLADNIEKWTREWERQGFERGIERGIERGQEQGQRALLRRLLNHRFGSLDDLADKRLEAATLGDMNLWSERLFDADTLDAVFNAVGPTCSRS